MKQIYLQMEYAVTTLNVNHRGDVAEEERLNVLRCRADILGTKEMSVMFTSISEQRDSVINDCVCCHVCCKGQKRTTRVNATNGSVLCIFAFQLCHAQSRQ